VSDVDRSDMKLTNGRELHCAVDRQRIGRIYCYMLTVNSLNGKPVQLAFCTEHRDEFITIKTVISRDGWV